MSWDSRTATRSQNDNNFYSPVKYSRLFSPSRMWHPSGLSSGRLRWNMRPLLKEAPSLFIAFSKRPKMHRESLRNTQGHSLYIKRGDCSEKKEKNTESKCIQNRTSNEIELFLFLRRKKSCIFVWRRGSYVNLTLLWTCPISVRVQEYICNLITH